jgi:hypothetical protein
MFGHGVARAALKKRAVQRGTAVAIRGGMRTLAFACLLLSSLSLFSGGCDDGTPAEGPCGDPVIECWTSTPGCNACGGNFCYTQFTGTGKCPAGYWCVDPRIPPADLGIPCDMARSGDL